MKRILFPLLASVLIAPSAFAHPVDRHEKPKPEIVQALRQIKPLPQSEIKKIEDKMPDMNGMMRDMMRLANDKDMRGHFKNGMRRVEEKLDVDRLTNTEDGIPDLNGLMSGMLSLLGDEVFINEMVAGIEPIAEIMEKHISDN